KYCISKLEKPSERSYEGSFYKDYKHGDALYCWPTGHKFIGKFSLNRKEGYGQQVFPDGATWFVYHSLFLWIKYSVIPIKY
uniref:Uncharacterized protein n=1 Tax=Stegastes partitus TaxID=144197 RepID=A0A3B5AWL3_9TELE